MSVAMADVEHTNDLHEEEAGGEEYAHHGRSEGESWVQEREAAPAAQTARNGGVSVPGGALVLGPSASEMGMCEDVVEIAAGLSAFPAAFLSSASFLRTSNLGFNKLSLQAFDSLQGLRYQRLKTLHLSNNKLKGRLPDDLEDVFPVLELLDLSHNSLTNVDSVRGLRSLTSLFCHYNAITDLAGLAESLKGLDLLRTLTLHENTGIQLANKELGQAALEKAKRESGNIITAGASSGLPPRVAPSGRQFYSLHASESGSSAVSPTFSSSSSSSSAGPATSSSSSSSSSAAAPPLLEQIAMLFASRCGNLRQLVLVSPLHALKHGLGKIGEKLLAGGGGGGKGGGGSSLGATIADNGNGSCAEVTSSHIGLCMTTVTSSFAQAAQQWAASPAGVNMERRLWEVARRHEEAQAAAAAAAAAAANGEGSAGASASGSPSRLSRASPSPASRLRNGNGKGKGTISALSNSFAAANNSNSGKPKYTPGDYKQRPPSERSKRLWKQGSPPRVQVSKEHRRRISMAMGESWDSEDFDDDEDDDEDEKNDEEGGEEGEEGGDENGALNSLSPKKTGRGRSQQQRSPGRRGGRGGGRGRGAARAGAAAAAAASSRKWRGRSAGGSGSDGSGGDYGYDDDAAAYGDAQETGDRSGATARLSSRQASSRGGASSVAGSFSSRALSSSASSASGSASASASPSGNRTATDTRATAATAGPTTTAATLALSRSNTAASTNNTAAAATAAVTTAATAATATTAASTMGKKKSTKKGATAAGATDPRGEDDFNEGEQVSEEGESEREDEEDDDGKDGSASQATAATGTSEGSGSGSAVSAGASASLLTAGSNVSVAAKTKAASFLSMLQKKTSGAGGSPASTPGRAPAPAAAAAASNNKSSNPASPNKADAAAAGGAKGQDEGAGAGAGDVDEERAKTFGTHTLAAAEEVTAADAAVATASTSANEMTVTEASAAGAGGDAGAAASPQSPSKADAALSDKDREAKEALTRAKTLTFLSRLQKGIKTSGSQGSNKGAAAGSATPTASDNKPPGDKEKEKDTEKPVLATDRSDGGEGGEGGSGNSGGGAKSAQGEEQEEEEKKSKKPEVGEKKPQEGPTAPLVSIRPFPLSAQITPSLPLPSKEGLLASPSLYRYYVPRSSTLASPSGGAFRKQRGAAAAKGKAGLPLNPEAAAAAIASPAKASDKKGGGNEKEENEEQEATASVALQGYRVTFSGRVFAGAEGKEGAEELQDFQQCEEAEEKGHFALTTTTEDKAAKEKAKVVRLLTSKRDTKVALRVSADGTAYCVWPPPLPRPLPSSFNPSKDKDPFSEVVFPSALRVRKHDDEANRGQEDRFKDIMALTQRPDSAGTTSAPVAPPTPTANTANTASSSSPSSTCFFVEAFPYERRFREDLMPSFPVVSLSSSQRSAGYVCVVRGSATVVRLLGDGSGFHTDARGFVLRKWDSSGALTFTSPHLPSDGRFYDTLDTLAANVSPSMVALPLSAGAGTGAGTGVTSTGSLPSPTSAGGGGVVAGKRAFLKVRAGESTAGTLMRPAAEVLFPQGATGTVAGNSSELNRLFKAAAGCSSLAAARSTLQHVAASGPRRRARSAVELGTRAPLVLASAVSIDTATASKPTTTATATTRIKGSDFAAAALASSERRILASKTKEGDGSRPAASAATVLPALLASVRRLPSAAFGGWLEIPKFRSDEEQTDIESGNGGGYSWLASAARGLAFSLDDNDGKNNTGASSTAAATAPSHSAATALLVDQEALRYAMLRDVFIAEGTEPTSRDEGLLVAASRHARIRSFFTADSAAFVLGRHLGVVLNLRLRQARVYIACRALRYEVTVPFLPSSSSATGEAPTIASPRAAGAGMMSITPTHEARSPSAASVASSSSSATSSASSSASGAAAGLTNPPAKPAGGGKMAAFALAALTSNKSKKTMTGSSAGSAPNTPK